MLGQRFLVCGGTLSEGVYVDYNGYWERVFVKGSAMHVSRRRSKAVS